MLVEMCFAPDGGGVLTACCDGQASPWDWQSGRLVIHPEVLVTSVIRADGSGLRVRSGGELCGEDVVPGFRCPVDALFPTARSADHPAAPTVWSADPTTASGAVGIPDGPGGQSHLLTISRFFPVPPDDWPRPVRPRPARPPGPLPAGSARPTAPRAQGHGVAWGGDERLAGSIATMPG
jgi:hypothetical protein